MIKTESTESRKQKAYNAGRNFALGSNDESCTASQHFEEALDDAWLDGYDSVNDEDRVN